MKDKKILIVDDDPKISEALSKPLTQAGAIVQSATSYEEGLAAVKATHPDAVILDVILKDSRSGLDLAKEIHSMPPPHPFVMILTNAINPDEIVEGMQTNVTLFMQKAENDPDKIASMLAKHFEEK